MQSDGDADGLGDACDPCTAVQSSDVTQAKLKLTGLSKPAGSQRLRLKMLVSLPAPIAPPMDPVTEGLRLVVSSAETPGAPLIDVELPPGPYDDVTRTGWTAKPLGAAFTFRSRTGVGGITKALVRPSPIVPGEVKLVLKDKGGTYLVGVADLPLRLAVRLNGAAGQCADFAYGTEPAPSCAVLGTDKIVCK